MFSDFLGHALDPVAWCKEDLDITPRLFQVDLLKTTARRIVLCCHRQSGKTEGCALLATHALLFKTGHTVLAAPTFKQSDRLARRVRKYLGKTHHRVNLVSDNRFYLETDIGSSLTVVSLDSPDNVRGISGVSLLIIDEAAAVGVENFAALAPSMAAVDNSQQVIVSTPRGQIGLFWELWNNPSYEKYFLPASKNPAMKASWLAEERKALGDLLFGQEYECSFTSAQSCVFDLDKIRKCICDIKAVRL